MRRADHTSEGCAVVLGNGTRDNPCATRRGESLSVIEVGRQSHALCEAAALTVILLITTLIEKTLCGHCSSGPCCCATPSIAGGHFGPISVLRDSVSTRARSKPERSRALPSTSRTHARTHAAMKPVPPNSIDRSSFRHILSIRCGSTIHVKGVR